jgi:hypothetical protein
MAAASSTGERPRSRSRSSSSSSSSSSKPPALFLAAHVGESCLGDYGLASEDFVGAMSNSGSDVKRCCMAVDCIALPWKWCGPHLFNRAIVNALGWTESSVRGERESGSAGGAVGEGGRGGGTEVGQRRRRGEGQRGGRGGGREG